ncbi:hypothetical protein [Bradyrhizobium liaoningense]|uniref:hypothetical protein n=1 Tax=Bradyrhizobium liaoningense TaxID=43992 RepID=UPI002012E655|nr:hypothetical protein [Bradyrhizobium liaoningense]
MTASTPLNFRKIAALIAAAGTLFWLYTFYFIAHVPPGDGSGFQWLAVFPLGMIFGIFFLPAWLLVAFGWLPRFTTAYGLCGLIAFAIIWSQLLNEFPKAKLY